MKKLITILLIITFVFTIKINVFAEGEEPTEETTETGTEEETQVVEPLKNIKVNGTNVVCSSGDNIVCKYEINDNDVNKVKITYDVHEDYEANPESIEEEIEEGTTDFKVTVTSNDGNTKKTYQFEITKKTLSTDSSLKKLTINGTEIKLKEGTVKYQASVGFSVKKLEFEAIPNDEKTKIIDFSNNKASFDFFENSKEIKIKVQSESGEMTTYTITINRRSEADVTLKSLTIKNHKIDFSSDVTDYELKVLKNVSKLEIEAKPTDKAADVKITNPKLEIGENIVKIEVSNDGNTNTYIINVTKLDEDDKTLANLKSLTIEGYDLKFSPSKYEYDLHIDDVNYLVIKAEAKLEESEVEITGNLDLEDGSIIKIKVSYDDDIYNIYKINIDKDGKVFSKKRVSKKAAAAVIVFDILSMGIIGFFKIKNKLNKPDDKDTKKNIKNVKKDNNKKNNIIENLDDIDII